MGLAELLRDMDMDDTSDRECPISGDDAIAALKAGFTTYCTSHDFKPGDLLVQKDGLATGERGGERNGNPCIFIRYETDAGRYYERARHGTQFNTAAQDCLVGWMTHDGGMSVSCSHAAIYEPYNDHT